VTDLPQLKPLAQQLLTDEKLRQTIAANGYERMGTPGAAQRIAQHMMEGRLTDG